MNTKSFYRLCISLVIGLAITACSNDEGSQADSQSPVVPDESGMYHYLLNLNCNTPSYDEEATTRSIVRTWDNAASIIVRFKSGTKFITGTATYSSSDKLWSIVTSESLPVISGEGTCELYYFAGASTKDANVALTESTPCYYTTSATYVRPSEASVAIQASLGRKTWRLRFKGTSGTSITLPKNDNEIKYFSAFNGQTGNFTDSQKDITLTVDNTGYTPYIYGTFVNSSGSNKITIKSGSQSYSKKLTNTNLGVGESAFMNIPVESSYTGWDPLIDSNATIAIDNSVTFTDGIVLKWELGSSAYTFGYAFLTKSEAEELTDEQIASEIFNYDSFSWQDADNYIFNLTNSEIISSNTDYYVVAVAKNSSGVRGPVLRYMFTTNSTSLPIAEVSNVTAVSSNQWSYHIDLKNNAKVYYLFTITDEDWYNSDWHFVAYYIYLWANAGELESHDWEDVITTLNNETCKYLTVCTWAMNSSGRIGNPHVAYGHTTSYARGTRTDKPKIMKRISKERLKELRDNMVIYKVADK